MSEDRVALLLHMHQPDYRSPLTGEPAMPWVRMHACRGYTDVPALAAEARARYTLNVVPSLIDQLLYYAAGGTDAWERAARVPAEELSAAERDFIRGRFVHGHPGMRRVSPRYRELEARAAVLEHPQDLRDLQVWSNLAWMGVVARRDPLVAALYRQDRHFDHAQLLGLLGVQRRLLDEVLTRWAEAPEVSVTPYAHPILPLLVDLHAVQDAMPHVDPGVSFRYPDDARRQVAEGLARAQAVLGRRVVGMWPSEGSVSPEVARLCADAGLQWLATDEGVLWRSDRATPGGVERAWRVEDTPLRMVFRDRSLSDRIGFVYASWDGAAAARDLLAGVAGRGVVPVALDGENPWESYRDAGEAFLTALFASGRTAAVGEVLDTMPAGAIRRLHRGSWIDANFNIWAGHPHDHAAWAELAALRAAWEDAGRPEAAWPAIRSAEGSDWFWWYGPEHHSDMFDLFDGLFRAHLAAGWRALGQPVPARLAAPIGRGG